MPRKKAPNTGAFVSHSAKDRGFVRKLVAVFQSHRIRYWYSAAHILGATQWHDEIGRSLRRCDWFIVVLTPQSVRSTWVRRELLYALNHRRYNARIIPLLCKPCKPAKLSWTLSDFQFVDFTRSFDAGCRQLLKIWKIKYRPAPIMQQRKTQKR
jgi:hypothetical protein